ncbi:DMT family transporter [Candidatus Halobonum tyrrellensis]|uniref:Dmt(Drug/metabolite transporter) superfamily permease n=1 Tax=Candidatus Halobonum tyrrellensis G22 TaxID=1324957 RepID=V4GWW5_9EURY|nr:EamA family transporter [Candidatus Halobonum tyrrellensis]ESP89671.1 dmt(drug/metabolite transporter) superfamily permease [Candidatus Halobonum tyrrellensis G22]
MTRTRYGLLACFLAASLCFGGTFVAAKAGLDYLPPLLFVALRFDVGAVLLLGYVVAAYPREQWLPRTRADATGILAAGVFAIGLANAFVFVGQAGVTSGVGSVVYSLNPILTPVFAAVLLSDERLSRGKAVGMLLGFAGVALAVGVDPAALFGGGLASKAAVLAAAVSGAFGSVLVRRADASLPNAVRTAWAVPVAALLCHALSLAAGETPAAATWTPTALVALGYVGVFSTAVAFVAYFALLDEAGAIRGNLVFYVVPVVATLGGWALLGESVSASTLVGFATIAAGFAVVGHEQLAAELSRLRAVVGRTVGAARSQ